MAAQLEPCRSRLVCRTRAGGTSRRGQSDRLSYQAHLAEVAQFVAKTATEVHGGMGFTDLLACTIGSSVAEPIVSG